MSFLSQAGASTPRPHPLTKHYLRKAHLVSHRGAPHLQVPQKLGTVRLRLNSFILIDGQEQGLQAGCGVHGDLLKTRRGARTTLPGQVSSFRRAFFNFRPHPLASRSFRFRSSSGSPQALWETALNHGAGKREGWKEGAHGQRE